MTAENTIGGVIHAHAANRPDNAAILAPGREPLSYAALAAFIDDIRARLNDCGIGRGDRVALAVTPRPEMAVAHFAVANAATSAPIDPNATTAEIENALVSLRATAMIASDNLSGHARDCASRLGIQILNLFPRLDAPAGLFTLSGGIPGAPTQPGPAQPNDVALTIRTSGTTSKPKVVCISHRLAVARGRIEAAAFALEHNDRCLNFRPLHLHSAINAGLMVPLSAGGGVILPAGFDAGAFFEQLVTFGATWFLGSPAYHDAILEQVRYRPDLRRRHVLRFVRSSSYRLAPEAMARLEATFGVPFLERFGGTESGLIARNPPPPAKRKPGTVGVPVDSEVALLGDNGAVLDGGVADEMGEILVRGAGVFEGYENNPEADAAAFIDGWYRTGDLGRWDEDGYLIVCGRVKEVINRGGQKISPIEVEDALLRHPGIAEVACFGVPHPTLGEDIAAAIVVNDPAQGVIDTSAVAQFLAPNLAAFKIPKRVVCCEALPRGPTGKLNRLSLAATLGVASIIDEANLVTVEPAAFDGKWEAEIAAIWRDILKLSTVGYRENFFVLGGESLMAARLLARIGEMTGVDLPVECIFGDGGTVAGLAQLVCDAENGVEITPPSSAAGPIIRRDRAAATPLSFSQERLRFLSELDPNDHIYNMQGAVRLTGSLEPNVLRRVLNAIVARHEILRASFPIIDGELRQVIAPELELDMPVIDLTAITPECREDAVQRIAREEARRRYDLARGPLIGAKLIKCEDDDHVLLLPKHHLVFDGQSSGILYREIAALYAAFARNEPSPLAELPIQFGDYAAWQRDRLSGPRLDAELAYWLDHLQGAPPLLDLPTDRPRPETQSYQGGRCWFSLSNALTEEIGNFSRRLGVTPFIALLAGFELLLHRYSGQDDFVLGTAVGGRTRPEVEELLGLFVNTLPLRVRFDGVATVAEHVARVRQAAIGAYAHQDMPFDRLVSALNPDRNASYAPVVQVLFGLMPKDLRRVELDDLTFERMNIDLGTARFDLSVMIGEDRGALEGFFEYSDDLFERATIERMIGHFEILLGRMIADSETSLHDIDLLAESERRQLLVEWNDTAAEFPTDRCIHELFEEQAVRAPDAVAVVFENHSLTYAELNARANQLAHHLIALAVGPEVQVGLCLERSLELVIGLLAILKAGGAYVPLDPAYPKERLGFMLQDSQAAVLLTQEATLKQLPQFGGQIVYLDRNRETIAAQSVTNPPCSADSESLAYVIYTSGSTGRPKGVVVEHRQVLNYVFSILDRMDLPYPKSFATVSTLAADLGNTVIFSALSTGAALHLISRDRIADAQAMSEYFSRHAVECLKIVPSHLAALQTASHRENVMPQKLLILGGEAAPLPWLRGLQKLALGCAILNHYGPTETTIGVATYRLKQETLPDDMSVVPLGRPLCNSQIYVLDPHLNPVPIGAAGELYIGGLNLTRGYLHDPELTAEKFIPNPFGEKPGERLYETGDRARYLSDGNIEFLGRVDNQVKIRGYRIEPGEVEAALKQHPDIRESAVKAHKDETGDKRLVAYVVARPDRAPSVGGKPRYRLPNGAAVAQLNKNETDYIYQEIFDRQAYLRHGITIKDGDCIFDVGANIGLFTLFANQIAKQPRVYSFEPNPSVYELLHANATLHGSDVKLFNCGLSKEAKRTEFTFFSGFSLLSGFYADTQADKEVVKTFMTNQYKAGNVEMAELVEQADALLAERFEPQTFDAELRTLSSIIDQEGIERIDLLKINVEKSELDVLLGIKEQDWQKIQQIVLEVDVKDNLPIITGLLERHGYEYAIDQGNLLVGTSLCYVYAIRRDNDRAFVKAQPDGAHLRPVPILDNPVLSAADLRAFLCVKLPEHMVPSIFMFLEALPLTPNGKVDRKVLPAPQAAESNQSFVAPRTPTEELLANIWAEVLKIDKVGIHDNFFELGGDSLTAMRLVSRLSQETGENVHVRTVFDKPTIRALAAAVSDSIGKEQATSKAAGL